jgi:predicted ferric reductase
MALWGFLVLAPLAAELATGGFAHSGPLKTAGRVSALLAFPILLLQPAISARFHWVERPFGLDRLLVFHRTVGAAAVVLAVLHPVFLALGSGSSRLLLSLDLPWQLMVGKAALAVLLVYAVAALFHGLLRLPFQWWLRLHNALTPVIVAGAFVHSWFIYAKFAAPLQQAVWVFLAGAGLFSWLHLTVYQRLRSRARPWKVSDVARLTPDVWSLRMQPPEGGGFHHLPGQFLFVTLLRGRGLPAEEHPFTIASAPRRDRAVEIAPKELGDFTATVGQTRPGDRAAVMAPYGRFSYLLHPPRSRYVMIAGGIGITPLMSMIRHMHDSGCEAEVLLLYGCRTASDAAFADELGALEEADAGPDLRTVVVLSKPDEGWEGEAGYIDEGLLRRHVDASDDTGFYICGPPAMMDSVAGILVGMGVDSRRIHTERFSL